MDAYFEMGKLFKTHSLIKGMHGVKHVKTI